MGLCCANAYVGLYADYKSYLCYTKSLFLLHNQLYGTNMLRFQLHTNIAIVSIFLNSALNRTKYISASEKKWTEIAFKLLPPRILIFSHNRKQLCRLPCYACLTVAVELPFVLFVRVWWSNVGKYVCTWRSLLLPCNVALHTNDNETICLRTYLATVVHHNRSNI